MVWWVAFGTLGLGLCVGWCTGYWTAREASRPVGRTPRLDLMSNETDQEHRTEESQSWHGERLDGRET